MPRRTSATEGRRLVQLADLEVRFRRSAGQLAPVAPPPAPLPMPMMAAAPAAPPSESDPSYDSHDDEPSVTLVPVKAAKVGVMYRNRHVGGKQVGKTPLVTEGSVVKRKAPLGYVEQLGTFIPVTVRVAMSDWRQR